MAFRASRLAPLLLASLAGAGCGAGAAARDAGNAPPDVALFDVPPLVDGNVAGYALSFDGINDYATSGNAGFPAASAPQTISLWVNYVATTATQDFIVLRLDLDSGVQIGIRERHDHRVAHIFGPHPGRGADRARGRAMAPRRLHVRSDHAHPLRRRRHGRVVDGDRRRTHAQPGLAGDRRRFRRALQRAHGRGSRLVDRALGRRHPKRHAAPGATARSRV